MTLIDLIKVLEPDTRIVVRKKLEELFNGYADDTMTELSPERLELMVENMWVSWSVYKSLMIEVY